LTLGDALGGPLGAALGFFLGTPVGSVLPIASVTLLGVSALSLAIGIYIVKRKKHG
jgi:LPXTG-motif cell wall-anchored protein